MKHDEEIAMVRRHVQQGERCVSRQRQIVELLKAAGGHAVVAEALLAQYETALASHQVQLARLRIPPR